MANATNLPQAIREPDVRITGTSYDKAISADVNTVAYLLPALPRHLVIGEQIRLATASAAPVAEAVPANTGGSGLTDTPYSLSGVSATDLKLIAAAAALPLNMKRTINDKNFNIADFYRTFLADAIRAEIERQLIVGDGANDTFVGLANLPQQAETSSGGTPRARNAEIDEVADACIRARGLGRADLIVCNRAARRKLMADFSDQNRGWKDVYIRSLGMKVTTVCLAQGWTPLVVSDFIATGDPSNETEIYFLVTQGENGCAWGTPRGMENVKFSTVRGQAVPEDWIIGEAMGALLAQDDQKIAVLNGYDITI